MGRACTSTIKVVYTPDGKCHVEMCHTHYGHDVQIQHIKLSKRQRESIAAKIQQGVSFDRILDDIRDNVTGSLQRLHILEKKDLRNIAISFNLDDVKRHDDDQTSVRSWINDWEVDGNNPILYYKLQGK